MDEAMDCGLAPEGATCASNEDRGCRNNDDSSTDSAEEGLSFLLGGLSSIDLSLTRWEADEDVDENFPGTAQRVCSGRDMVNELQRRVGFESERVSSVSPSIDASSIVPQGAQLLEKAYQQQCDTETGEDGPPSFFPQAFERAFHATQDGRLVHPPVRIVDMSLVNNRGFSLIATRRIRRGEVIYTERAAEAAQIPSECPICPSDGTGEEQTAAKVTSEARSMFKVRGCQHCFRSMEPASSCCLAIDGDESGEDQLPSRSPRRPSLPLAHLWPVPEYDHTEAGYIQDEQRSTHYLEQRTGRVICRECGSHFCSLRCRDEHEEEMGTCCRCTAVVRAALHTTSCRTDEALWPRWDVQPPVVLAARMFCAALERYRSPSKPSSQLMYEDKHGPYWGMCGEPEDMTPLELGLVEKHAACTMDGHESQTVSEEDPIHRYSLASTYAELCNVLSMCDEEKKTLNLEFLHRLSAVAARNSFAITTQSPFRSYHASLLRVAGGRGTDRHEAAMKDVAISLGSPDGKLTREMDREVLERCAVQTVALFTLTARINHSCNPCAEVRCQEFVDCRVDLVATRDINAGDELTISYINLGRSAGRITNDRSKRIRELKARYLFVCDCTRCQG